jgi:hypothetical protein
VTSDVLKVRDLSVITSLILENSKKVSRSLKNSPRTNFAAFVHPDVAEDLRGIMTQTSDPFLREQQMKIRAVLRKNTARRLQGKKKRGIKWIKSKQAQCTVIGHVMIAKRCVYCGTEE